MCGFAGFAEFLEPFSSREDLLAMQMPYVTEDPMIRGISLKRGLASVMRDWPLSI